MKLPEHIAIIMDGNGRWAQARHRPRTYGHIKGARVAKRIITQSTKLGVKKLTLFAFSTENWSRPIEEVSFLMNLLERYIIRERTNLIKENIRFKVIGDITKLPQSVLSEVERTMSATQTNSGLELTFALNYGSRQELSALVKNIAIEIESGELTAERVDEHLISKRLQEVSVTDPDLIIRTSGEMRLSNFLLWQAAYSEFYFTKTLWPDFTEDDFLLAIKDYSSRERRFGTVSGVQLMQVSHS